MLQLDDKLFLALSDEALLASLVAANGDGNRVTARIVAHLVLVEDRRLELKAACPSLFDFCTRKLGMSDGVAFRRITAARLVRRFPSILARIERGEVALATLVILRDVLTEENLDALLDAVRGKGTRDVHEIVARLAPKPDVPDRITRLRVAKPGVDRDVTATPLLSPLLERSATQEVTTRDGSAAPTEHGAQTNEQHVKQANERTIPPTDGGRDRGKERTVLPLSEGRYKVQFTANAALRDKLERAHDLLRHKHPRGGLATTIEEALDALLERLTGNARIAHRPAEAPRAERQLTETRTARPRAQSARSRSARTQSSPTHGSSTESAGAQGHRPRSTRAAGQRTANQLTANQLTANQLTANKLTTNQRMANQTTNRQYVDGHHVENDAETRRDASRRADAPSAGRAGATTKSTRVRASTRREVIVRDDGQCTFTSESGERCPARAFLQLDHVVPQALGGSGERGNLRLLCRAHNRLAAEEVFGREHVDNAIARRRSEAEARKATSRNARTRPIPTAPASHPSPSGCDE